MTKSFQLAYLEAVIPCPKYQDNKKKISGFRVYWMKFFEFPWVASLKVVSNDHGLQRHARASVVILWVSEKSKNKQKANPGD